MKVICIRTGNKYSEEYATHLESMVSRHLNLPYEFICLRDDDMLLDVTGWWHKLQIFSYEDEVLYLDLDVIITGSLDRLVEYGRAGHYPVLAKDWWYDGFHGSVIYKPPGKEETLWDLFSALPEKFTKTYRSDQELYTDLYPCWRTFPDGWVISYKAHVQKGVDPMSASVICFHGKPDPHEIEEDWVSENWC